MKKYVNRILLMYTIKFKYIILYYFMNYSCYKYIFNTLKLDNLKSFIFYKLIKHRKICTD